MQQKEITLILRYFYFGEEKIKEFIIGAILDQSRPVGLVAVLLLLAQDLELQELLLLLQETSIRGVHLHFAELLLLVRGNILMVLQFFHPRPGLSTLFAAGFVRR